MPTLKVRLDIWGAEEKQTLPEFGVVASIYDVTGDPARKKRTHDLQGNSLRDRVIPAGPLWEQDRFLNLELEPGTYLVEAILPSGRVVEDDVSVADTDEPQELRMFGGQSGREWLGWQHFLGNVEQDAVDYRHKAAAMERGGGLPIRVDLVSSATLAADEALGPGEAPPPALIRRGLVPFAPGFLPADPTASWPAYFPATHLQPVVEDGTSALYRFIPGAGLPIDFDFQYRGDNFPRYYLFLRGAGIPPQYSVLPVPWKEAPHSGEDALVEVLVQRQALDPGPSGDAGHRLSVTVHDPAFGSVIGYLGAGDLPTAGAILAKASGIAEQMLFDKVGNPLAAAAGAYVLLATEGVAESRAWHPWVDNLMHWFPWLPDGAIQSAWVRLGRQEGEDSLRQARHNLLEAYRRGLPLYARGVRLLLDGLTLFANEARATDDRDAPVEEALQAVREWAVRTNMRQPFTSLVLD